jgi:hypothetical protein
VTAARQVLSGRPEPDDLSAEVVLRPRVLDEYDFSDLLRASLKRLWPRESRLSCPSAEPASGDRRGTDESDARFSAKIATIQGVP